MNEEHQHQGAREFGDQFGKHLRRPRDAEGFVTLGDDSLAKVWLYSLPGARKFEVTDPNLPLTPVSAVRIV